MRLAVILTLAASPAIADVSTILSEQILPGHAELVTATTALAEAAANDCAAEGLKPAFHNAYDAWIAVSHIQFGPGEEDGLALAMAFWPDTKDRSGKALSRLFADQDPIIDDPATFGDVSVAAQGFTALEQLLYDPQPEAGYACRLTRAIATGLAEKSSKLNDAWPDFAELMTSAGGDGNARFQSEAEVERVLYTALSTGLEFLHDQRLGRPLGSFDRPRPLRAEARRSERSLRHIQLSLAALEALATAMFDGDLPKTRAAFAEARARANALDDPALEGVADPAQRFRVEVLQRAVQDTRTAINDEIGTPLGISAGFNALDGD